MQQHHRLWTAYNPCANGMRSSLLEARSAQVVVVPAVHPAWRGRVFQPAAHRRVLARLNTGTEQVGRCLPARSPSPAPPLLVIIIPARSLCSPGRTCDEGGSASGVAGATALAALFGWRDVAPLEPLVCGGRLVIRVSWGLLGPSRRAAATGATVGFMHLAIALARSLA